MSTALQIAASTAGRIYSSYPSFGGYMFYHKGDKLYSFKDGVETQVASSMSAYEGSFSEWYDRGVSSYLPQRLLYKTKNKYKEIKTTGGTYTVSDVNPYTPYVCTEASPVSGVGNTAQQANRISAYRTVWYTAIQNVRAYKVLNSPDSIVSCVVDGVYRNDWSYNSSTTTVTFTTAPTVTSPVTPNTVRITLKKTDSDNYDSVMDGTVLAHIRTETTDTDTISGRLIIANNHFYENDLIYWNDNNSEYNHSGYFAESNYKAVGAVGKLLKSVNSVKVGLPPLIFSANIIYSAQWSDTERKPILEVYNGEVGYDGSGIFGYDADSIVWKYNGSLWKYDRNNGAFSLLTPAMQIDGSYPFCSVDTSSGIVLYGDGINTYEYNMTSGRTTRLPYSACYAFMFGGNKYFISSDASAYIYLVDKVQTINFYNGSTLVATASNVSTINGLTINRIYQSTGVPTPTQIGSRFSGWYLENALTTLVSDETIDDVAENLTSATLNLYAGFTSSSMALTYDIDGEDYASFNSSEIIPQDTINGLLLRLGIAYPRKSGAVFLGWSSHPELFWRVDDVLISDYGGTNVRVYAYFTNLIYDRTEADVARVKELKAQIMSQGLNSLSTADFVEYMGGMKGAYNATDLNRVALAANTMYSKYTLSTTGTALNLGMKEDWIMSDIPTATDIVSYQTKLELLRGLIPVPTDTPTIPDCTHLDYSGANDIEKFLYNCGQILYANDTGYIFSGMIYSGGYTL